MENHTLTKRNDKENKEKKMQQIMHYLQNRVMPIVEPLQVAALQEQPDDLPSFCLKLLKQNSN